MKKMALGVLLFIGVVFMGFLMIFGGGLSEKEVADVGSVGNVNLPEEVLRWKDKVNTECQKNEIPDAVPYILALIMVESGGNAEKTPDIMQCSESKGWPPNTIQDPNESIEIGVAYFASGLKSGENIDPLNVIQGYNYGYGYLSFCDDVYSFENAIAFSKQQSGGQRVTYINAISTSLGYSWRYNYGNMFYAQMVKQYLGTENNQVDSGEYGFILPVQNPNVSSGFGPRVNPVTGKQSNHNGLDFAQPSGDKIYAVADGEVVIAQFDGPPVTNYGNCVIIKHDDALYTLYAHQSSMAVRVGDKVKQGQVIGYVGSTGQSTGPHLHFEVRLSLYGNFVDPATVLPMP
ncbi:lysozyme family protein [Enterococcus sp. LJL90]